MPGARRGRPRDGRRIVHLPAACIAEHLPACPGQGDVVALVKRLVGPGGVSKGHRPRPSAAKMRGALRSQNWLRRAGPAGLPIAAGQSEYLVHLVSPMCGERGDEGGVGR